MQRDDWSYVTFHPGHSKTKVECKFVLPAVADMQMPRAVPGGTNGPGNFKHFTQKHVERHLKFDAKKTCKGKGKGKTLQVQGQGRDIEV